MNEFLNVLVNNLMEIVFAAIGIAFTTVVIPWVKDTAIPWLKEKRLYSMVQRFVNAAEKKAEAGSLAKALKKDYVIERLEAMGVTVTTEVDAFIEAAVKELDIAANAMVGELVAVMGEEVSESEEQEAETVSEATETAE